MPAILGLLSCCLRWLVGCRGGCHVVAVTTVSVLLSSVGDWSCLELLTLHPVVIIATQAVADSGEAGADLSHQDHKKGKGKEGKDGKHKKEVSRARVR